MIVLKCGTRYRLERVLFSPDGADVVAPLYSGIQVWRPFTAGAAPQVLPVKFSHELYFAPDGATLYAVAPAVWAVAYASGPSAVLPLPRDAIGYGVRFALAPGGDRYLLESMGIGTSLRTLDGKAVWKQPDAMWWGQPRFLPGGEQFVALQVEGQSRREQKFRVVTHDTATGREVRRSDPLVGEVRDWVVSPDGTLAACWTTVWVHVYPLRESFGKPRVTIRNDNRKEFTGLAFHPSGKYLATTSNDETVKLYDTSTWEVARTFTWNIGKMRSIAFSPDGTLAAAGSDTGKVVVWDVDL